MRVILSLLLLSGSISLAQTNPPVSIGSVIQTNTTPPTVETGDRIAGARSGEFRSFSPAALAEYAHAIRNLLSRGQADALYQPLSLFLGALSTNTVTGSGRVVLESVTDGIAQSVVEAQEAIADRLLTSTWEDYRDDPRTNTNYQAFSDLGLVGTVKRTAVRVTGSTPNINWSAGEDFLLGPIDGDMTVTQSNAPADTNWVRRIGITIPNATASNYPITTPEEWEFISRRPEQVLANSVMTITLEYLDGTIYATWEGEPTASKVQDGGTGVSSLPAGRIVVGAGTSPVTSLAIGDGLETANVSGVNTLRLSTGESGYTTLTITNATAGVTVWTNSAAIATNTALHIHAFVDATGSTNSVTHNVTAAYRRGSGNATTSSSFSGNSTNVGVIAALLNTNTPVLQVYGGAGEVLNVGYRVLQSQTFSFTATATDPWAGYVFSESFEGTGAENTPDVTANAANINADATDYYSHGAQSWKVGAVTSNADYRWYLPSGYSQIGGKFSVRISAAPSSLTDRIWYLQDSNTSSGNQLAAIGITTSRTLRAYDGSASYVETANAIPTGEWVTIYWHYTKGTGSNSITKIGWSTDGSKTSTAGNIATKSDGASTADMKQILLRHSANIGNTIWVDAIVAIPDVSWDNLPAGLPEDM